MEHQRSYDLDNSLDNYKPLLSDPESRKALTRQITDRKKGIAFIIFFTISHEDNECSIITSAEIPRKAIFIDAIANIGSIKSR